LCPADLPFVIKFDTIDLDMITTSSGHDLSSALFGKTRRAVLALFFGHPEEWFYLRQVARLTGSGLGAVQRELKGLAGAGIIVRRVQGRQVYFRANPDCPIYPEMKGLILKTAGLCEVLSSSLRDLSDRIEVAFIFGSMARGEGGLASDVDLLVVGVLDTKELVAALAPAQSRLNREVNPVLYPEAEFRQKAKSGGHFVRRVLSGPRIFVIGGEDELT